MSFGKIYYQKTSLWINNIAVRKSKLYFCRDISCINSKYLVIIFNILKTRNMNKIVLALFLLFSSMAYQQAGATEKKGTDNEPVTGFEQCVNNLISKMTLKEKIFQLLNDAEGIERLNIPSYNWWNEALHGVARNGRATIFPQVIGMAATFDTTLIHDIAAIIFDEVRGKFNISQKLSNHSRYAGLTFWTPNVNIFGAPYWGRGQETYGEDSFLTSNIGGSFVRRFQDDHPKYLKTAVDKNIKSLFVMGLYAADVNVLLGNYYGTSDPFPPFPTITKCCH